MNKYTRSSLFSALFALLIAALFTACGSVPGTGSTSAVIASTGGAVSSTSNGIVKATTSKASLQSASTKASLQSASTKASKIPLKVTGVDMGLTPSTIRNLPCGSNITETYTATFHFSANSVGGPVTFEYTVNNGRASQVAHIAVRPGQTSATYTFHWSGQLDAASTLPGPGGVLVTVPNAYFSKLVAPLGPCMPVSVAPFKVSSASVVAGPELTGHRCGTFFTEVYTATFHIAAGGPGGTLVFQYTVNNGRSSSANVLLKVAPKQTIATYTFKWSGLLPVSHTIPGIGIVMVTAPNQLISSTATPPGASGGCSTM